MLSNKIKKETIIMKRIYQIPEITLLEVVDELSLMAGSVDDTITKRQDEGAPTKDGFPTGIGTTSETPDPFGNHGQNGNTTRAKGSMWDDFDEEW